MSWPTNPINGQRVQINGILYEFNASNGTWDKVAGSFPGSVLADDVQTANLIVTGNAYLGDISNVTIEGGSDGYVMTTDGLGNLTWEPQSTVSASGSNGEIQYNKNNQFFSNVNLNFDDSTGTLSAPKIAGSLTTNAQPNITSVGRLANLTVGNATANVTIGNGTITTNTLSATTVTGNFTGNFTSPGSNTQVLLNNQGNIGGSSNLTFTGNLLTVTGNINATNANLGNLVTANLVSATLTVANQPNITRVGTLVNLTSNGNITAPNFIGNVVGGNISGNVVAPGANTQLLINNQGNIGATANITFASGMLNVAGNINTTTLTATSVSATTLGGSLTTGAQPNITSTGTLSEVVTTGNVNATANVNAHTFRGNVVGGTISGTFSAPGSNSQIVYNRQGSLGTSANLSFDGTTLSTGSLSASNNVIASNNVSGSTLTGTLTTAAQPNITSVGTLSGLDVTANVVAGNVYANSGTIGATRLTGTLTTNAQPNVTSVGTLTNLSVTGNITSGNVFATSGTISANAVKGNSYGLPTGVSNTQVLVAGATTISSSTNLTFNGTNLAVTGNATVSNNFSAANVTATQITGSLTTSSQPNITSVGTLTKLDVTNDVNTTGVIRAVKFIGPIEGDVTGSLAAPGGAGSNREVLFNLSGAVTGNNRLLFDPTGTATLTVTGNLVTGNANLGNRAIANVIQGNLVTNSQPNITTIGTLTGLTVNGPITISNCSFVIDANTFFTGNLVPVISPTTTTDTFTGDGTTTTFTMSVKPIVLDGDILIVKVNGVTQTDVVDYAQGIDIGSGLPNKDIIFTVAPAVGATIEIISTIRTPIYDLGTRTNRWRDLWLSGNTIKLGGATITSTDTGTIDTGAGEFQSEILTATGTDVAPFIVYSSVTVANLSVQYLDGMERSSSNLANTVVNRDEFNNFQANTITGNLYGVANNAITVTASAQPNITSVGALTSLIVTNLIQANEISLDANITAEQFKGGGGFLENINGANVSQVPEAAHALDADTADFATDAETAQFAVNVTGCSQPNITTVGTLGILNVTGNVTGGNIEIVRDAKAANFIGGNVSGNISGVYRTPVGSSNTEVMLNYEGNINSTQGMKFNFLTNVLTITGKFNSVDANLGNLVEANFFKGAGNNLSNIRGSNVQGEVAFAATANAVAGANVSGQVGNALVAGTVYSSAQPAITSVGTLTDLNVSSPTLTVSNPIDLTQTWNNSSVAFTGIRQVITDLGSATDSQLLDLQVINNGNPPSSRFKVDKVGNVVAGNIVASNAEVTITKASQPFITSLGTLTTLTVDANIQSGNANLGNLARSNYFSGDGSLLTNVPFGNALVNGTSNVRVLSGANINMSVAGVDDVLTLGLVSSSPVANFKGNIFTGNANLGNLAVANFFSGNGNALFNVQGGNVVGTVANATHACTANTVTNAVQSSITSLGTLTALTVGATVNPSLGNNVTASFFTGTLTTAAQPNVTSLGRLTGLTIGNATANTVFGNGTITATGNIQGSNVIASGATNAFYGNAYGLTDIPGANVTGTVSLAGTATVAGTVTTAAQPNITSVNTISGLTSLKVSGDTQLSNTTIAGNLTVTGTTITANATSLVVRDPMIEMGGNLAGGALTTNDGKDRGTVLKYFTTAAVDAFMGWDSSNSEFAFGSNVSVASDIVTFNALGNVRANYFLGNGSLLTGIVTNKIFNGTSNVEIATADGNVTVSVGGTANVILASTLGANIKGYANITGNANVGNLQGTQLLATVNVTAPILISNTATGTAPLTVTSTTRVANLNVAQAGVSDSSNVTAQTTGTFYPTFVSGATAANYALGANASLSFNAATGVLTATGANANSVTITGTASGNSNAAAVTGSLGLRTIASTYTDNVAAASTTIANAAVHGIGRPTLAAANTSVTATNAATFFIQNAPASGTNMTIGNAWALYVGAGNSYFGGDIDIGTNSFKGNGSQLTGIVAATSTFLSNGTSNVSIPVSSSNITMSVAGNANVFQINGNGNVEIKGTLRTGLGSGGAISGVDTLTANTVTANIANGTSNIRMTNNGNVTVSANSVSNIFTITGGTSNGANVSGYVSATGQIISTVATGTAPLQVTSTTRVANLNVNYANVSDFEAVTIATTGTYYPTFINGITAGNYAAFANSSLSFNAATGALTASSFVGSTTGPLANGISNVSIATSGGNVTISAGGTANVLTVTSTGILGTFVNSSDIISFYTTASVTHDFNTSSVLYVSGISGTPTFAFTNLPTTNSRAIVIPIIIAQGATAITYPTSISINGVAGQTINYLQGTTPTGRANKTEVLGLSIIRTNAGAWVILGSVSSYG